MAEEAQRGPTSAKPAEQQRVTYRYIDRPECMETFADSIVGAFFDGQSLRLEFGISRLEERKPDAPLTARRHPRLPFGAVAGCGHRLDQQLWRRLAWLRRCHPRRPRTFRSLVFKQCIAVNSAEKKREILSIENNNVTLWNICL